MALPPLKTILNTAPIIIQGAGKLVQMLRQRQQDKPAEPYDIPANIDDMKVELGKLHERLDVQNNTSLEQVQLIEELARQNEAIASSLKATNRQLNLVASIALIALVLALISLVWLIIY